MILVGEFIIIGYDTICCSIYEDKTRYWVFTVHTFQPLDLKNCKLDPHRIDVWQYSLQLEPPVAHELLNPEERERAQRFYFDRHRRRFTVARAMLRVILAHYLQIHPKEVLFEQNKYGKPHVQNHPQLHFNLSHSSDLALLAVGQTFPLGIDVEIFSTRPYQGIGSQMFSERENRDSNHLAPRLQPLSFFHIWAQKEALIKACGLGLSYPTTQFNVPILPPTNQLIDDTLHNKQWQMVSFMPNLACCAALCHHPSIEKIYYLKLNDFELMQQHLEIK